ncbi:MAG TPA: c-type cytochrome [Gammaproteobacteria bacterium]|nr:c-type cytochrome [Gammaproteobacteria bacterium]
MTKRILTGLVASGLAAMSMAALAEGDAAAGRKAAETCLGCHAVETYFNVYPTYHVPKVGGQSAAYVEAALKAYRDGGRKHATMNANAANLSDQDIANIAAFFASQGK